MKSFIPEKKKKNGIKYLPKVNMPLNEMTSHSTTNPIGVSIKLLIPHVFNLKKKCSVLLTLTKFLVFIWFLFFLTYPVYPTPLLGQDLTQGQFFKQSLTGLNSVFSFS